MGNEFGGLGNVLLLLVIFITFGSTALLWLVSYSLRRESERRRRYLAGEPPLPPLFGQSRESQETMTMQEPPHDDNQNPDSEFMPPELEFLIHGHNLPTSDIDEIIRDVPEGYSEGQPESQSDISEAREGEVMSEVPSFDRPGSDDDWEAAPEPGKAASSSTAVTARVDSNELPEDAIEVMRVYRDLNNGKLIFQMKDRIFASAQDIEGSQLAERFSAIVEEMVKMETGLHWRPSLSTPPSPPPAPMRPAASLPQQNRANNAIIDEDQPEPTIGDQIEDYLQQRLAIHPEFAGRRIHIRPSLHGSVAIEVDGQFYDAVADIPDGSVRAFLQKTIQDWSDRH